MATDAELIRQTLQGDKRAFANLVEKYQPKILTLCQRVVKSPQDAEELMQDTFFCAYQNLRQLRDKEKFPLWLKQIARNQCKMYLRRKTSPAVSLVDYPQLIARQATAEEEALYQELLDAILQAIETLPKKDQQIVQAHLEGLSHAEIGKRTGLSYQASLNRLYRARQKIKEKVRHLLSCIGALPKWFSPLKLFSGGITMKIATSAKITAGVFGLLLAGFLGWKTFHHETTRVNEVKKTPVAQTQTPLPGRATFKSPQQVKTMTDAKTNRIVTTPPDEPSEEELREFEALLAALEASLSDADKVSEELAQEMDETETQVESADSTEYAALEELIRERIQLIREWKIAAYELNRFVPSHVMSNGERVYELKDENDPNRLYIKAEKAAWEAVDKNTKEIATLFPNAVANIQYDKDGTPFVVGGMKLDFGKIERALGRTLPHAQELLWIEREE